ncbi:hypothetical protein [Mesorhizobium sp.]|uniref:hypothetical protein n=1 Tax=Mesorhizobium sp. TaxID=1871066 RepID=UPI0025EF4D2A|nr:hypothetical protein [Mesorhizobium sp.]
MSGLIERRVLEVNPAPTSSVPRPMAEVTAEVWAVLSRMGTKDEIGKKAENALISIDQVIVKKQHE